MCAAMAKLSLPPGFRFHPTDVELILYFLKRKIMGKKLHSEAIAEVDIYEFAPWDLPGKSCLQNRDLEWYFFCPRHMRSTNGSRANRATAFGFWKTTGLDRSITHNSETVGMKKTLIFHEGRAPHGVRTNWVIHEYRLEQKHLTDVGFPQDTYVLCKLYQKSGPGPQIGEQHGAPFIEEDWDNEICYNSVLLIPTLYSPGSNGLSSLKPILQPETSEAIGVRTSLLSFPQPETSGHGDMTRLITESLDSMSRQLFSHDDSYPSCMQESTSHEVTPQMFASPIPEDTMRKVTAHEVFSDLHEFACMQQQHGYAEMQFFNNVDNTSRLQQILLTLDDGQDTVFSNNFDECGELELNHEVSGIMHELNIQMCGSNLPYDLVIPTSALAVPYKFGFLEASIGMDETCIEMNDFVLPTDNSEPIFPTGVLADSSMVGIPGASINIEDSFIEMDDFLFPMDHSESVMPISDLADSSMFGIRDSEDITTFRTCALVISEPMESGFFC